MNKVTKKYMTKYNLINIIIILLIIFTSLAVYLKYDRNLDQIESKLNPNQHH